MRAPSPREGRNRQERLLEGGPSGSAVPGSGDPIVGCPDRAQRAPGQVERLFRRLFAGAAFFFCDRFRAASQNAFSGRPFPS